MNDPKGHQIRPGLSRREFLKGTGAAAAAQALAVAPLPPAAAAEGERVVGMGPRPVKVELTVNGKKMTHQLEPRVTLLDALRNHLDVTGCKRVCDRGTCGACTVLLDGAPVRSCLMFAVQAEGKEIRTVEGLANGDELNPLQRAFMEHHALQCGFCTPGFLMLLTGVFEREPDISDAELVDVLSSNLCRCTGYQNIIKAARAAAAEMRRR